MVLIIISGAMNMPEESLEEKMKISKEIRESLVKANTAVKEDRLKDAALAFKTASDLSKKLGHTDIAQDYLEKANDLMGKVGEPLPSSEIALDPISEVVSMADKAIAEGNFKHAAKIYEDAARLHPDEAKKMLSEAMALRQKERDLIVAKKEMIRKADTKQSYEETLIQIKEALEKGQHKELVTLYGRAAIFAEKLGKREEATDYRKAAIEAKKEASKELKALPKEGRINLVQEYTAILKDIKVFLDEKKWQKAADGYIKAAKLAVELQEFNRAKVYKQMASKYQEQANEVELETSLRDKRAALLEEVDTLNGETDTDTIVQNYREVINISQELGETEGLNEINESLKRYEKVKRRKKVLSEANGAIQREDYSKALELFQKALSISIDLNETTKVEGFRSVIEELKGKVDKVARDRLVVEQRADLLADAKVALREDPPNIAQAISNYKEAARISIELGEDEIAKSYLQTAKRIEEDENLIIERENFVKEAEAAVKEKNFLMASNFYQQAAKFSEKLDDRELAEKYQKKARALKDLAEEL
jgi:tetratricopeptide (TPR) repeat protein